MMKVNDFQKYEITLSIPYDDYFKLIYESKHLLETRLGANRTFIAKMPIYANNRKNAVRKAVQKFRKDFKGNLGPASKVMVLNDPFQEVSYNDDFACNDLGNKYLDDFTVKRVLEQAHGDLTLEVAEVSENFSSNSLKRLKRRRKINVEIAPRLFKSPNGSIFYKMVEFSDAKDSRRKTKTVKLSSKSLQKALREVRRRGLDMSDVSIGK